MGSTISWAVRASRPGQGLGGGSRILAPGEAGSVIPVRRATWVALVARLGSGAGCGSPSRYEGGALRTGHPGTELCGISVER